MRPILEKGHAVEADATLLQQLQGLHKVNWGVNSHIALSGKVIIPILNGLLLSPAFTSKDMHRDVADGTDQLNAVYPARITVDIIGKLIKFPFMRIDFML